jgi:hypothetical protein
MSLGDSDGVIYLMYAWIHLGKRVDSVNARCEERVYTLGILLSSSRSQYQLSSTDSPLWRVVHNRFLFTRSLPDAVPKMKFRNVAQACLHRRKWIYEIWLTWLTWPYFISQRQPKYVVKIQDHQYVRTYCTRSPIMRGERVRYARGVQKPVPEGSNKTSYLRGPSRSLSLKTVTRPHRSQDLWDMRP